MAFRGHRQTPYENQYALSSRMFYWSLSQPFASSITDIQLHTGGTNYIHFIERSFQTGSSGYNVKLLEDVGLTTGTSELTSYNVNRASTLGSTMKIYSMPSAASSSGSTLENITLIKDNRWDQLPTELILKRSEDYVFRINNTGSTILSLDINFVWYELASC
jgi:hypothetical protein